jgi:hypothetical protein
MMSCAQILWISFGKELFEATESSKMTMDVVWINIIGIFASEGHLEDNQSRDSKISMRCTKKVNARRLPAISASWFE